MKALQALPVVGFCRRLLQFPATGVGLMLAVTAVLGGCTTAPTKPESMVDQQANFTEYKTFGWHADTGADGSGTPVSLVDTNIRAAITTEMKRKGYEEAAAGSTADLLIDYEVARTETLKNKPFRIGIGVGSYGSGVGGSVSTSSSSVKNVSEGSLVIHAIDSARNAEVWRSRVSRELSNGTVKSEVIQSAVAEVFSDFPARTGSSSN